MEVSRYLINEVVLSIIISKCTQIRAVIDSTYACHSSNLRGLRGVISRMFWVSEIGPICPYCHSMKRKIGTSWRTPF